MNWYLEFGPESALLEVPNISTQTVVNSIELLLSRLNLRESQRLRFVEETLTGAPLTQEQQQRSNEINENLEAPRIQVPSEDGKVRKYWWITFRRWTLVWLQCL